MSMLKNQYISKLLSIRKEEFKLLIYSTLFIFLVFASYAILRPIRDSLGLEGGEDSLKWLFLGTLVATILSSVLAMFLSAKIPKKYYLVVIYGFFIIHLVLFYVALFYISPHAQSFVWLCRIFYVWVSIFNMFVISSAWSLLTDIFTKDSSHRLFGIISAGASLGSIGGAFLVSVGINFVGQNHYICLSIIFLSIVLGLKSLLIKEARHLLPQTQQEDFAKNFSKPVGAKNPFEAFGLIVKSPYLLAFVAFIVLLSSVSTFLYMEQARIVKELFSTREERIQAFAYIDLIVQIASFIIQVFLTAKITQYFGIKFLLSVLGFIVSFGFIWLIFVHPAFLPLVIVMSIRRIGEYALVKPGREMLFVPFDSNVKYKVKIFLDTVVYRGGDALSAQLEGILTQISVHISLLAGALFSFVWGLLGLYLGKRNNSLELNLTQKTILKESKEVSK